MGGLCPRPAHWKADSDGKTVYACFVHEQQLRAACEHVEATQPHERDSARVWCDFCTLQGDIAHVKE